ncbi:MAG: peptide chain release factor N(5)-glutamine methyltransferase [Actinobacteria bacterium]|nr:peptide chain release factor N(5)-glutamine methyltransferase [Actinomycetota bacterium]
MNTISKIAINEQQILLAHVLGISRKDLSKKIAELGGKFPANETDLSSISKIENFSEKLLDEKQLGQFNQLINLRSSGQPLQYVMGVAPFRYLELFVGPGVLIPRPETEKLVEIALNFIWANSEIVSVVDLGAGSGAISIAIYAEVAMKNQPPRNLQISAVEKSESAIEYLKKNIAKYEAPIRVVESDIGNALIGVKADLILANPPYIPDDEILDKEVSDHEPQIALRGGSDGTKVPGYFFQNAVRMMKSNAIFIMEHHENSAVQIKSLFETELVDVVSYEDLNGRTRFTSGRKI